MNSMFGKLVSIRFYLRAFVFFKVKYFAKMGKHKNKTQNSLIVEFMEKYPDLARNFTKRDKPTVDSLWQQLAETLNSAGPPQKDVNGWRKIWTEWKSDVKRKVSQNKAEAMATGGGPFSKYKLTDTEEAILRICNIAQSVDPPGVAIGLSDDLFGEIEEPSTSSKRALSPLQITSTPKRRKVENTGELLKKFLDEDSKIKVELNEKLDELLKLERENASSLRRVYRAIEKGNESVANAVADLKNEYRNVNRGVLQAMQEKNEIKIKQLELDTMKFEFEKNSK